MQHLVVKEQLTNDDEEKIVESKCPIEANNDGASSVENKENQNSLPKSGITAQPQVAINEVESDDEEKIAESKCQIEAKSDGASTLEKIENKNSLPNQHAGTIALPQEATNKVKRPAPQTWFEDLIAIFPSFWIAVKK